MKKRIVFLAVFILLSSCISMGLDSPGIPQDDPAYTIETVRVSPKVSPPCWSFVSFQSAEYMRTEEAKKAAAELREPKYMTIPAGGLIIIQVNGRTIGSADGKIHTFIVLDAAGAEVARTRGNDRTPNYSIIGEQTTWWGFHAVGLFRGVAFPLRVRIVNQFYPDDYYEYSIVPVQK